MYNRNHSVDEDRHAKGSLTLKWQYHGKVQYNARASDIRVH